MKQKKTIGCDDRVLAVDRKVNSITNEDFNTEELGFLI
jgi:hypothetical protein